MRLITAIDRHLAELGSCPRASRGLLVGKEMKKQGVSEKVIRLALANRGYNKPQINLLWLKLERPLLMRSGGKIRLYEKTNKQLLATKVSTFHKWFMCQEMFDELCSEVKIRNMKYKKIRIVIVTSKLHKHRVELKSWKRSDNIEE